MYSTYPLPYIEKIQLFDLNKIIEHLLLEIYKLYGVPNNRTKPNLYFQSLILYDLYLYTHDILKLRYCYSAQWIAQYSI